MIVPNRFFWAALLLVSACAHRTSPLRTAADSGWHGENWQRIERFVSELPAEGPRIAAFDCDNTLIRNDVGDATLFWMLRNDRIRKPSAWEGTSPCLSLGAIASLRKACDRWPDPLPTSKSPDCADAILSIYAQHRVVGTGLPAWKAPCASGTFEPAYAWAASLLGGHSPAEVRKMARVAIDEAIAQPIGNKWRIGRSEVTGWIRPYPEMRRLIDLLRAHRFDIWVVSASAQPVVESLVSLFGVPPERVIGIRNTLDESGRFEPFFEGCGEAPERNQRMISYRRGKTCWLRKLLPHDRLLLAAGDSDTDIELLEEAGGLRLVINRNKAELMCRAYANRDGRWLVNPMFIDPLPEMREGYHCDPFETGHQRDAVFGSSDAH